MHKSITKAGSVRGVSFVIYINCTRNTDKSKLSSFREAKII